jgi:EVE domain
MGNLHQKDQPMPNWIAVASANHVAIGVAQGFMQVNHGKSGPLRRISPGDLVTYYSPTAVFGTKTPLQAFTAIGRVQAGEIYIGDMGGGFTPSRRDVVWWVAGPAAIAPLLSQLEFTAGKTNWGYAFRFGLFSINDADIAIIAGAMGVGTMLTT